MQELGRHAKDQLEPEIPWPREEFAKAANDGPERAAADGSEDDIGDGVLLVVGFEPERRWLATS